MALEEVGAKLVVQGEDEFIKAFNDTQKAIDHLAETTVQNAKKTDEGTKSFDNFKKSATELKAKIDLAKQAFAAINGVLEQTIGKTLAYSDQVRDLSRISGASAEDTSRLIQASDDLSVSYDTLKMASKAAADQGISLTVEKMAALQEQYQQIQDPAAKVDFLTKTFGRNGLELAKVLEVDANQFRNMAAGIDESLIMTDKQIKEARNLEIALDDWHDTLDGLIYGLTNKFIPILNTANTSIKQLQVISSDYVNILDQHNSEVKKTAATYDEYITEIIRAAAATGQLIDKDGNLYKELYIQGVTIPQITAANFAMSKSLWDVAHGADGVNTSFQLEQMRIDNLKPPVETLATDTNTLADSMRTLTAEMIFNQLASGLNKEAQFALAQAMGLIPAATLAGQGAMERLRKEYDDGKISLDEYIRQAVTLKGSIEALNDKTITITTIYRDVHNETGTGTSYYGGTGYYAPPNEGGGGEAYASGGSFKIPEMYGYEGYPLGPGKTASGGETVVVLPKTAVSAGPSNYSYSTANNYNLQVMSSQSPAVVQRSFAMMKLLAG